MELDFNTLWNYSQPAQTREKFVELAGQIKNGELNAILELETQIARTYSLQSEFIRAHEILDKVEDRLTDETQTASVRYFLERGRTFNSDGKKDEAKSLFVAASVLAEKIENDNLTIDAIHMVAIAAADFEEKLEWTKKGIAVAKNAEDPAAKRWEGVFYNNSGWDLFERERYEEALEKFEACRDFHAANENERGLSIAIWSVAKTYRVLGRIDEALSLQLQNLEDKGGEDPSGYTYEELGELYFVIGDSEKAKDFFAKAHAILVEDKWLVKNEAPRLDRLLRLSKEG